MTKLQTLAYVALTTLVFHADAVAVEGSVQLLNARGSYYGGFSLAIDLATNCPAGSYSCQYVGEPGTQGGPCCPNHTFCSSNNGVCCPTSADCSQQVDANPTCGDPSWTLLSDENVDYICCPAGMVSDEAGECVAPGQTGYSSQETAYSSVGNAPKAPAISAPSQEAQPNNAAPTGDATITGAGGSAATTSPGGGSAPSSAAAPGTGSPAAGGGSTPTSGGASPSATKKSTARRSFVADGALALAGLLAVVSLLL